jgi:hypothetical protein
MKQSCNGRFDEKLYKERTKSERVGDQKGKKRNGNLGERTLAAGSVGAKQLLLWGIKGYLLKGAGKILGGRVQEK